MNLSFEFIGSHVAGIFVSVVEVILTPPGTLLCTHEINAVNSGERILLNAVGRGVDGGVIVTSGISHLILCHGNGIFVMSIFAASSTDVLVKNNNTSFITTHAAKTINNPVMAIFMEFIPSFLFPGAGPDIKILNPLIATTKTASVGAIIQAKKFRILWVSVKR